MNVNSYSSFVSISCERLLTEGAFKLAVDVSTFGLGDSLKVLAEDLGGVGVSLITLGSLSSL